MRKNGKNPENIALNVMDLACERGGFEIFSGVSFHALPGEVILLRGPTGRANRHAWLHFMVHCPNLLAKSGLKILILNASRANIYTSSPMSQG